MSERDAQISAGSSSPRLDELSRAVTRSLRSAADAASTNTPSFAESLASASQFVEGDDSGAGANAGDDQGASARDGEVGHGGGATRSGYKTGESSQPGSAATARA